MAIEAGWLELQEAQRLPRNAKLHNLKDLAGSFGDFGFVDRLIINRVTGHLVSGHGRLDALVEMKSKNWTAPENVKVENVCWYVPADWIDCPAEREDALALRLNISQMKGGQVDIEAILGQFDAVKMLEIAAKASAAGILAATGLDEKMLASLEQMNIGIDLDVSQEGMSAEAVLCQCPKCGFRFENG